MALMNSGGIRSSIQKGEISFGGMLTVFPFEGTFDQVQLTGSTIRKALEHSVRRYVEDADDNPGEFPQVSGFQLTFDMTQPSGRRVANVKVRCQHCDIPTFVDLDDNGEYCVLMPQFLSEGGDGFNMIPDEAVSPPEVVGKDIGLCPITRHFNSLLL